MVLRVHATASQTARPISSVFYLAMRTRGGGVGWRTGLCVVQSIVVGCPRSEKGTITCAGRL